MYRGNAQTQGSEIFNRKLKGYLMATRSPQAEPRLNAADQLKCTKWVHRHSPTCVRNPSRLQRAIELNPGFYPGFNVPMRRALKWHQIVVLAITRSTALNTPHEPLPSEKDRREP